MNKDNKLKIIKEEHLICAFPKIIEKKKCALIISIFSSRLI